MGPIGLLCIRRTLADGRATGFAAGLGAATADALYGSLAAFGLTALATLLIESATPLRLAGGLFLLYLGLKTLFSRPADEAAAGDHRRGLAGAYVATLFLTLTNPMTVLAFTGIFAGLGAETLTLSGGPGPAVVMVAGVFTGSALWWLLLSGAVSMLRGRFTPVWLLWVNRLSGLLLLAFALTLLAGLLPG